jgi:hypothetical protein
LQSSGLAELKDRFRCTKAIAIAAVSDTIASHKESFFRAIHLGRALPLAYCIEANVVRSI